MKEFKSNIGISKNQLMDLLNANKDNLSFSMLSYLRALIDLEFSVIKDNISDEDRLALSQLEIYKKAAMYNIYKRAIKLFEQNESSLIISCDKDEVKGLKIYTPIGNRKYKLFDYSFSEFDVPQGSKEVNLGTISLYQSVGSEEQIEAELERILTKLEELYNSKNPYPFPKTYTSGTLYSQWDDNRSGEIDRYEGSLYLLDYKRELSSEDRRKIEISGKFHKLLLDDYGLTDQDFIDDKMTMSLMNDDGRLAIQRKLVKTIPGLTVKSNIRYF